MHSQAHLSGTQMICSLRLVNLWGKDELDTEIQSRLDSLLLGAQGSGSRKPGGGGTTGDSRGAYIAMTLDAKVLPRG